MKVKFERDRRKEIDPFELTKLRTIEKYLNEPIPKINEIQKNSFGYVIEDGHIVALGLYDKEIFQLKSRDLNFPYLKTLILRNFKTKRNRIEPSMRDINRYPKLSGDDYTYGIVEIPRLEYLDVSYCNFNIQYLINRVPSLKSINLTGANLLESQKEVLSRSGTVEIESKPLKPDLIYKSLTNKEIIKSEAIYQLKILLERTDITSEGMRCIEILEKISNTSSDAFEILENCLVAFNNPYYRAAAAKAIIIHFLERGQEALTLIIEGDPSVLVLTTIYQLLGKLGSNISKNLRKKVNERYARFYNLIPEEAQFFLDLHIENINDFSYDFALKKRMNFRGEVKNNRITLLDLSHNNLLYLPDSIANLSMVESLNLQGNMFIKLPNVWKCFKHLKFLDLSHNMFLEEIPESLYILSEFIFAQKYIEKGVIPEEAMILGVIEFFLGFELENVLPYKFNYKVEENGHVIELRLISDSVPYFSIIPDKIDQLKYLNKIAIGANSVTKIPESIGNLKHLKELDISINEITEIPKIIRNLQTLEHLDLSYNKISKVPEWVCDLKNLKRLNITHNKYIEIPQSVELCMKDKLIF